MEPGEARMLTERWKNRDKWKLTLHRERADGINHHSSFSRRPHLLLSGNTNMGSLRVRKYSNSFSFSWNRWEISRIREIRVGPLWVRGKALANRKAHILKNAQCLSVSTSIGYIPSAVKANRCRGKHTLFLIKLCRVIYAVWISYEINTMKNVGAGSGRERKTKGEMKNWIWIRCKRWQTEDPKVFLQIFFIRCVGAEFERKH